MTIEEVAQLYATGLWKPYLQSFTSVMDVQSCDAALSSVKDLLALEECPDRMYLRNIERRLNDMRKQFEIEENKS